MRDRALTREYEASCDLLRQWIKPGDVVLTCVLHTSRSGRERVVGAWAVNVPERAALERLDVAEWTALPVHEKAKRWEASRRARSDAQCRPRTTRLFGHVARVLNLRADIDRGGVVTRDGAGNELVMDLGRVLYGDREVFVNEEL